MSECNLCGKDTILHSAEVEGAIIKVCDNCLAFGRKVREPQPHRKKIAVNVREMPPEIILVKGYGNLIIKKRTKMGLERKDFAKKIREKESMIKRVELEQIRSSDKLTKKIENFLDINLTTTYERVKIESKTVEKDLTLGDIVSLD